MKKKFIFIILICFLTLGSILHSYFFTNLYSFDEIWNFGFGYNISQGLIPYKDFSMIIPPFFPYIVALFLKIFGSKLIVYHFLIGLIVSMITYLAWRKIGFYAILIYIALLIYSSNGYNLITLFLLFLLLQVLNSNLKTKDILSAIIISGLVLSKQTLFLLVIPNILYAKKKKKVLCVYFVIFLSFLIYLLGCNSLYSFIDYCFLGMFEFASENGVTVIPYLIIEIFFCLYLIFRIVKTKEHRQERIYTLLYQILVFPIVDISHFVLGWSCLIYLVFQNEKISLYFKNYLFIPLLVLEISILIIMDYQTTFCNYEALENYPDSTFLEGRLVPNITKYYLSTMKEYRDMYADYEFYVFGGYGYLVKLSLNEKITKYDLINAGNMGYQGSKKYIKEIDDNCHTKKCLFFVNDSEINLGEYNQTDISILLYVSTSYYKIYSSNVFGVYIN